MNIRLKYKKVGDICYISHLDILKLMERIIRRAKINIAYSEGFNPHPKISFSPALQLGVQSISEFVDLTIDDEIEVDDLIERMNRASVNGLEFLEGKILEEKTNSIVAFITNSLYEIKIEKTELNHDLLKNIINSINSEDEILLTKKTKKGKLKEYNMKEFIDPIKAEETQESIIIYLTVCSGSEKNINPKVVIDYIKNKLEVDFEFELIKLNAFHRDINGKEFNLI